MCRTSICSELTKDNESKPSIFSSIALDCLKRKSDSAFLGCTRGSHFQLTFIKMPPAAVTLGKSLSTSSTRLDFVYKKGIH